MASNEEWTKQLLSLRALTASTGAVHEAQLLNLKQWGAIAFHYLKPGQWEASVDVESKNITYNLQKGKRPAKLNFARTLLALNESVHWLLGPDWELKVKEGNNLIYQGDRTLKNVADERNARASAGKGKTTTD